MSKRKLKVIWREDDSIRVYQDTPDKRGVNEMQISNTWGIAWTIISNHVGLLLLEL